MKNLILVLLILIASCNEEDSTDPLVGNWTYSTIDQNSSKPTISASFNILTSGDSYTIDGIAVEINGITKSDYTYTVNGIVKNKSIETIIFSSDQDEISFHNSEYFTSDGSPYWFYVDSVVYVTSSERHRYLGQRLTHP